MQAIARILSWKQVLPALGLWLGLLCIALPQAAWSAAITINSNTLWSAINTGSGGSGRPNASDTISVINNATLTIDVSNARAASITLGNSTTNGNLVTANSNSNLTVSGAVTLGVGSSSGNLNMSNGGTLALQQFLYVAGTFTPGTGTVSMTANNTLPNAATFAVFNHVIQNAGASTILSRDVSINGILTLSGGVLDSNGKTTTVSGVCNTNLVRPANGGYVSGLLRLSFAAGSATCVYPLGSATGYAPISIDMVSSGSSGGGSLSAASVGAEHPQIASSGLDATRNVNRYWRIWQSGDTISASSYNLTLNYNGGDIDSAATTGNFILARYNGATWNLPSPFIRGANAVTVVGQAGPFTTPLSFAVGEAAPLCNPPTDITGVSLTCVCENFSRSNLNPSAIYGADWALSSSGGSFGLPKIINQGTLRLTDNSATVATAATVPANFPGAGNMIVVEFKSYAYNGSGADGLALTLSDSAILPQPGAYGGSLGYAQKVGSDCTNPSGCAGFAGGWIGVALDEYGNFSSPTEGRVGGPGSRSDAVAVRGSGSGASTAASNYPYLDGTASLATGVDNPSATAPSPGHAYRVVVDARSYTPSVKKAQVSVYRDTGGSGNFNAGNLLLNFDAYQKNPAQAAVPSSWKLSFTGSTGGLANIHEIGGLKICAQSLNPPTSFRIDVDNVSPNTCGSIPSGKPQITITALDINRNVITNYNKTVTLKALLANGSISSGVWAKLAANGVLSGNQYTFSTLDQGVAKFILTDTVQEDVTVGVLENGSAFGVTYATPLQFRGGSFSVANTDNLAADTAGGVVAGRPHLFSITRSTSCGTDTSYSGAKLLDGWYSAVAASQPAGAAPPQICQLAGGNCKTGLGSCASLPSTAPVLSASSNNLPSLSFSNGVASFCLLTTDIGRYSLNMRDDSVVSAPIAGASATLTARPFAVLASNVQQTPSNPNPATNANTNPTAPDNVANPETAPFFVSAGSSFSATVGGYLWNSAADTNDDGLPDSTAILTDVIAKGITPNYADSVSLLASPLAGKLVPVGGIAGTVGGSPVALSNGRVTVNNLSYSEVGSFAATLAPTINYLASGVDLTPRAMVFANPSLNTRSNWIGRFRPNHFQLTAGAALINRSDINGGTGCAPASNFTYMSESFNLRFGLTAVNLQGVVTRNYVGNYAKLSGNNWFGFGVNNSLGVNVLGVSAPAGTGTCNAVFDQQTPSRTSFRNCTANTPADVIRAAGPRLALVNPPAAPSWLAGQSNFNADLYLRRADTADGPYANLQIGFAPVDSEGVTVLPSILSLDMDRNGSNERQFLQVVQMRYGRMNIANAYGSELLPLPVAVQAQYWNGSKYILANDDACTPLLGINFLLDQHTGGIDSVNAGNMNAGNIPVNSGILLGGQGTIRIAKPVQPPEFKKKGSVTLNSLINYLPGNGRLTFGLYKAGPVIYVREMY